MKVLSIAKEEENRQLLQIVVLHCHPCVRLKLTLQQLSSLPAEILLHVDF